MLSAAAILGCTLWASLPEVPQGSEVEWSTTSADVSLVAHQTATESGCHLEVRRDADQTLLWERNSCFGGKSDRHLLSSDGTHLIVLASYPPFNPDEKLSWRKVPVVWLFVKGSLVEEGVAGQFVKDVSEVRLGVSHFEWLQGVNKVPGVPPRLGKDGQSVELEAVDGTHRVIFFSGLHLPPLAALKDGRKHH